MATPADRIGQLLGNSLTDINGETVLPSEMFSKVVYDFIVKTVDLGNGTEIQPYWTYCT